MGLYDIKNDFDKIIASDDVFHYVNVTPEQLPDAYGITTHDSKNDRYVIKYWNGRNSTIVHESKHASQILDDLLFMDILQKTILAMILEGLV